MKVAGLTQWRKALAAQQIDREKLRTAIRRVGSDYLFLMVDAAITVLTEDSLRTLVKGFLNLDELQPNGKEEMSLLENIKAFRKASLQGNPESQQRVVEKLSSLSERVN